MVFVKQAIGQGYRGWQAMAVGWFRTNFNLLCGIGSHHIGIGTQPMPLKTQSQWGQRGKTFGKCWLSIITCINIILECVIRDILGHRQRQPLNWLPSSYNRTIELVLSVDIDLLATRILHIGIFITIPWMGIFQVGLQLPVLSQWLFIGGLGKEILVP